LAALWRDAGNEDRVLADRASATAAQATDVTGQATEMETFG
jgi:hypothetical protein